MTLILDATVGGASANSFSTLAEAAVYNEAHIYGASWFAMPEQRQKQALITATRILTEHVGWKGIKATRTQALPWPRIGVSEPDGASTFYDPGYGYYSIPSNIIPVGIKNATAELGRILDQQNRMAEPTMPEFTEISVGSLSLSYATPQRLEVLPESVRVMVGYYGSVNTSSGIGIIKLVRA